MLKTRTIQFEDFSGAWTHALQLRRSGNQVWLRGRAGVRECSLGWVDGRLEYLEWWNGYRIKTATYSGTDILHKHVDVNEFNWEVRYR